MYIYNNSTHHAYLFIKIADHDGSFYFYTKFGIQICYAL